MSRKILFSKAFKKEFASFPSYIRDDILHLITEYLDGVRLPNTSFKTFALLKGIRIQEFKMKDHTGNWRAVSCFEGKEYLTFVYAFHKKSQGLLEKDKKVIAKRVKEILK